MSGNDIFNAISNIDPKYIDEAAYELHSQEETEDSVSGSSITDISTKRKTVRARRLIWVVLPSVAAVLLILGVAIPAILRTGSTQPAATAEAPAETAEATSEASADNAEATEEAETTDEAAPAAEEVEQAVSEASAEEPVADEAPAMPDEPLAAGADSKSESNKDRQTYTANAASEYAEAEAEAEETLPSSVAVYENGLLTIDTAELLHGPLDEAEYAIFDINAPQSAEPVVKGSLKDVTEQKELTDEPLVLDLTSLALKPGEYRIEMETGTAEFTVSR